MGDAKRRKQQGIYASPRIYTLFLYEGHQPDVEPVLLCEIPFTAKGANSIPQQKERVCAIAMQVMGFLVDMRNSNRIKALKLTLGNSAFLQLRNLGLPDKYYCLIQDPNGNTMTAEDGIPCLFCNAEDAPPPEWIRDLFKGESINFLKKAV